MDAQRHQRCICIGASAGGVDAILALAAALPARFPAPILFVQHIGAHRSRLPDLVSSRGPNPAINAEDGMSPEAGTIYIAPPDHHLLLVDGVLRLFHGPKEHHARPAIDPLFRSVALACGPRAIGVVLTGMLDDGTAGLGAIKDCGGTTIVQDPVDAFAPSMPQSALDNVEVDHVAPLASLGALLVELAVQVPDGGAPKPPTSVQQEYSIMQGVKTMETLAALSTPSMLTCPDCGGVLSELNDKHPVRYRCHTGHAFSLRSLAHTQSEATEAALWTTLRALQEKETILRRLARIDSNLAPSEQSEAEHEANEIARVAALLRSLTGRAPTHGDYDAGS